MPVENPRRSGPGSPAPFSSETYRERLQGEIISEIGIELRPLVHDLPQYQHVNWARLRDPRAPGPPIWAGLRDPEPSIREPMPAAPADLDRDPRAPDRDPRTGAPGTIEAVC